MPQASPSSVFRFTSVLTARSGKIRYFRAPGEVPADLQRDLDRALQGELTANVILADEGGQTYLQTRAKPKRPVESPRSTGGDGWSGVWRWKRQARPLWRWRSGFWPPRVNGELSDH